MTNYIETFKKNICLKKIYIEEEEKTTNIRSSKSVEGNVEDGNVLAKGHSTAFLTPSLASPGPTLSLDKEFSP